MSKTISINDVISHYNIIGMGIGVAIGIAGKELAFSLSNDIVMPLLGKIIQTKFFNDYELDVDKFFSSILTFSIVFGVVMFLLYVVLKPMVKQEILSSRKFNHKIIDRFDTVITYQKSIDKNTRNLEQGINNP